MEESGIRVFSTTYLLLGGALVCAGLPLASERSLLGAVIALAGGTLMIKGLAGLVRKSEELRKTSEKNP